MSKNKKQNNFKFNTYWLYAIIIGIFLIFQLPYYFSSGENIITPSKFFKYLKDGDVKKVEIVNKREARVYITDKALSKENHRQSKPNQLIKIGAAPNYSFEFGDVQLFQKPYSKKNEYDKIMNPLKMTKPK